MSKAVKQIVGIVAAIAIPFAAPAIASAIGLSGVIGSAFVGAGLGAANAAITGGNVGRGALLGAVGGGIGGYTAGATATPGAAAAGGGAPVYDVTAAGQVVPAAGYGAPALTGAEAGLTGVPEAAFGAGAPPPAATSGISSGFTPAPTGTAPSLTSGMEAAALENPAVSGFGTAQAAPAAAPTAAPAAGLDMGPQTASQANASFQQQMTNAGVASRPATFVDALRQVPDVIAAKFKDPKALADMTLRAAGQLAGSAIAGDGLSDQERALLQAQTDELRTLQQTNQALFNQRLEQAQSLIGESKYFDPEYFGLQRARREQLAGAKAKAAGLRGLEGPRREAAERRYDLTTARNVGTAYDQGYGAGVTGRLQTMQAGLTAMPSGFPSSMGDYTNLRGAYSSAASRARETQRDIGDLFGSFTGRTQSQGRG